MAGAVVSASAWKRKAAALRSVDSGAIDAPKPLC